MQSESDRPLPFGSLLRWSISFFISHYRSFFPFVFALFFCGLTAQIITKSMVVPADTPGAILEGGTTVNGVELGFSPYLLFFLIAFGVVQFFGWVVLYLVNIATWCSASNKPKNIPLIRQAFSKFWPLLKISLWGFVRAQGWLFILAFLFWAIGYPLFQSGHELASSPFIIAMLLSFLAGIICMIYYSPRLVGAPLIHLREGAGTIESVNLSLRRTKGYWGRIIVNTFLLSLTISPLSLGIYFLSKIQRNIIGLEANQFVTIIGITGAMVILKIVIGIIMTAFRMKMSDTIFANPKLT